jgi:hypothetical protein
MTKARMTEMTKKIFEERPDIKEKVMRAYPEKKREKKCRSFKEKQDNMRESRAKRLYENPET